MQIAFVHQVNSNLFSLPVRKKNIIRQDHGSTGLSICFQAAVNMLQKVQLLITGRKCKIVTGRTLSALFRAKGWISKNHIIIFHSFAKIGKRISQYNIPLHIMQHGVHQSQPMRIMNQFGPCECFFPLKFRSIYIQIEKIIRPIRNILVSGNHKAKSSTGRIITALTDLWFYQPGHHIDQNPGRKILSGAGFFLIRVLFQQSFIQISQTFFAGGKPVQAINGRNDLFQIFRLVNICGSTLIDLTHTPGTVFSQMI